jgi:hypothetical protein
MKFVECAGMVFVFTYTRIKAALARNESRLLHGVDHRHTFAQKARVVSSGHKSGAKIARYVRSYCGVGFFSLLLIDGALFHDILFGAQKREKISFGE